MDIIKKKYELNLKCYVINLKESTERMELTLKELGKIGIIPERFDGIRHKISAVGCGMSHCECLKKAIKEDLPYVLICEDDIQILDTEELMDNIYKFIHENIDWDVLLLSANNFRPYEKVNNYCIKIKNALTTGAYIVKKHYYKTLLNIFQKSVDLIIAEPNMMVIYTIDQLWKYLQRKDNFYLLIPVNIIQRPCINCNGEHVDYSSMKEYDKIIHDPIYN